MEKRKTRKKMVFSPSIRDENSSTLLSRPSRPEESMFFLRRGKIAFETLLSPRARRETIFEEIISRAYTSRAPADGYKTDRLLLLTALINHGVINRRNPTWTTTLRRLFGGTERRRWRPLCCCSLGLPPHNGRLMRIQPCRGNLYG